MDKLVLKQKAYSSKISIFYSPFSKQKKAPISLFGMARNIEILPKIKYFGNVREENSHSLNIRSHPSLFPHTSDQIYTPKESKKRLPNGSFFSHAEIYGLNTFCIALHMIIMDKYYRQ